jgi:molybdenum cofactor cytidylyltransferase
MIGLVLLAAGPSTRLGEPKQQLLYQGETLLQRALHTALNSECQPVVLVLGAYAESLLPAIPAGAVRVILNPTWSEGMASSIRMGLLELQHTEPRLEGVIFMLCDQPFVEPSLLNNLIRQKQLTGKEIIACSYQDTIGTPALFSQAFFSEILTLQGQEGAKKLLFEHSPAVATITFEGGAFDIDTPADYTALQHFTEKNS